MHQLQTVGEIVRLLRSRRGIEQVELARACGWRDASAVSRIETDRIHPTRKTLLKLAENLADGAGGGTTQDVRAWLFFAAGVLPAREEIAAVASALPAIERWEQPAALRDFGWNLWRANEAFLQWIGLPQSYEGRSLLDLMFTPPVRQRLEGSWRDVVTEMLTQFRAESEHRARQRWYRATLASLERHPEFASMWAAIVPPAAPDVFLRSRRFETMGALTMIRLTMTCDPRLTLTQIVAEDERGAQTLARSLAGGVRLRTTLEPRRTVPDDTSLSSIQA